jgi:hypothetical protein
MLYTIHITNANPFQGTSLLVLPCCLARRTVLKQSIGLVRWKEIRAGFQAEGNKRWREATAIQARNELLAKELPEAFKEFVVLKEIRSIHNTGLRFVV